LEAGEGLWLFLEDSAVPATNNLAERQIRPLVIAKKISFGVKSERGARFIERIYSLVLTSQQQNKEVIPWLQNSITQYFTRNAPPILV
jgi:transposase